MAKYLVNSTYCIYLLDVSTPYFDDDIFTINEVANEVTNERGVKIDAKTIASRKATVIVRSQRLSEVDLKMLETAKAGNYILVSDDKKLITAARDNKVKAIDTPHFMHRLLIEKKLSEEKVKGILMNLKGKYNRTYVIEKVLRDIENWRG